MSVIKRFAHAGIPTDGDIEQVMEKMEALNQEIKRALLEGGDTKELGLAMASCLQSYLLMQKRRDRVAYTARRAA